MYLSVDKGNIRVVPGEIPVVRVICFGPVRLRQRAVWRQQPSIYIEVPVIWVIYIGPVGPVRLHQCEIWWQQPSIYILPELQRKLQQRETSGILVVVFY